MYVKLAWYKILGCYMLLTIAMVYAFMHFKEASVQI